ncbi:MAG: hypothetical protein C4K49_03375 [Candidatus Thorarchaeota archaeon]|nr:MAG: hypothetical protein C4K49_03375 [Candidatus Thorarchaeota archaeon]
MFKSMRLAWTLFVAEALLLAVGGYWVTLILSSTDSFFGLAWFIVVAMYAAVVGFCIGWKTKKSTVIYVAPQWQFEPLQLKADECRKLVREHNRQFRRLVAASSFWHFYIPIPLILANISLPYDGSFLYPALSPFIPLLSSLILLGVHATTTYGGFSATSNAASPDFTLPLIREAVWVASVQSKIPNISNVRVLIDRAQSGNFVVYRNPRVIARIAGLESDAYIESWSGELRAVSRVLCRLSGYASSGVTTWLWDSRDRNFIKSTALDKEGYYVRNPVPSRVHELGVKDVLLITQNAVALILIEYSATRGEDPRINDMLEVLGVKHRKG